MAVAAEHIVQVVVVDTDLQAAVHIVAAAFGHIAVEAHTVVEDIGQVVGDIVVVEFVVDMEFVVVDLADNIVAVDIVELVRQLVVVGVLDIAVVEWQE